ncbi:MAG: beta-propeller domain-containing protein [Clostridia bacterium]|nr:beta-propeller domain-containing protein [Clostridia bacterium]
MEKIISGILAIIMGVETAILGVLPEKEVKFKNDDLVQIKSEDELKELLSEYINDNNRHYVTGGIIFDTVDDMVFNESAIMKGDAAESATAAGADGSNDFSETNVQVEGVDESDIVKTNGEYIYYLTDGNLQVIKAFPADNMEIVKTIEINEDYWFGNELYLDENYITVVGTTQREIGIIKEITDSIFNRSYYKPTENVSTIKVYDVDTYELVREFNISGNYVSSRKIGDDIYMISNKYIYDMNEILPVCRDTAESVEYKEIPANEICYFKDFETCNYMIVSSVSLDKIKEEANVQTFLGAGSEIYASKTALYVTRGEYDYDVVATPKKVSFDVAITTPVTSRYSTKIHKFEIDDGEIEYTATGSVPGSLLNQFSMDEYDGYFRITTTDNTDWENSTNNLYVLDKDLEVVGKIEGLAKGERIYSTRFMGDKCYVVTYKTVDPLFVIDLSNPNAPEVLGELKIPGYSDYLHPFGENYLIGFGKDSVEKSYMDWNGEMQVTAYDTGLKLAIFDITEFSNPKELHSVKIGGRGSWSELSSNHKSLLFDEEMGIFAFPATVCEETKFYKDGTPMYGDVEFEGALIFDLSVEDGIKLRGKISHKNGNKYSANVERILYIQDVLYTLSSEMVKANDINTVEEIGKISIDK